MFFVPIPGLGSVGFEVDQEDGVTYTRGFLFGLV